MNKTTKLSLLALTLVAAILIVWYSLQSSQKNVTPENNVFNTPNPALQNSELPQKDPSASAVPLPPLPADNKQAIDSEIQGIDQSLQATDAALSTETTDAELGL